MRTFETRGIAVLAFVVAALVMSATGRERAAPRIIMLHSGMLGEQRIFMTDWHENARFLASSQTDAHVDLRELTDRAEIQVALFWGGGKWEAYASDQKKLETLTPDSAGQQGRIFGGFESDVLLLLEGTLSSEEGLTLIGSEGLAILKNHGVPGLIN